MDERAAAEALAKRRFTTINLVRLAGVAQVLLALAVFNEALDWPQWAAVLLLVNGMADTFLIPTLLARRWSTRER